LQHARVFAPPYVTYRITAYSDANAPCDLDFSLADRRGSELHKGKLAQARGDTSKWIFEFKADADVNVETWQIKTGRAAIHPFKLDENTVIDSRHSYIVNSLST
jgi:hypothetical protein